MPNVITVVSPSPDSPFEITGYITSFRLNGVDTPLEDPIPIRMVEGEDGQLVNADEIQITNPIILDTENIGAKVVTSID